MPTLSVPDGEHLAYQVDGAGPPLTFVSGLSGTGDFWEHQVAALRDRFTCVTHDQRGTGSSSLSPIRYSIAQMADDVLTLLDELDIGAPLTSAAPPVPRSACTWPPTIPNGCRGLS